MSKFQSFTNLNSSAEDEFPYIQPIISRAPGERPEVVKLTQTYVKHPYVPTKIHLILPSSNLT